MKILTKKLLQDLVGIPSFIGNTNPSYEIKVVDFLKDYFSKNLAEFNLREVPFEKRRKNLLFFNAEYINILFACHIDTVAPSSKDALTIKFIGDKAYGLGTKDMKGGIVSTILAIKQSHQKGVGVLFYGDEETSFKGIRAITKASDELFSKPPKLIVSPESRFNLGVGARGIAVYSLKVHGQRAHSARPHLGIDAVKQFIAAVNNLEKKVNSKKNVLGDTNVAIVRINGGLLESNGSISHHAGTIPDYVEAIVSVRNSMPDKNGRQILDLLNKEGEKLGLKMSGDVLEDYPARMTHKKMTDKIKNFIKLAGYKAEVADSKLSGYNDVAILGKALNCPVVNFGPYGEGNHTKDEWVSLKSIEDTAKVFERIISDFTQ